MKYIPLILTLAIALAGCDSRADQAAGGPVVPSGGPPVDANGNIAFRAGLWEQTETLEGETEVFQECRAAGVDQNTREFLTGDRPGCTRQRSTEGGALLVSLQCRRDDLDVTATFRLSGSETRYRVVVDTTIGRQGEVATSDRIIGEARWLSECPAGMEPGDRVEEAL